MSFLTPKFLLLGFILFNGSPAFAGGTTIVGDGGLIVECPGQEPQLFDLFEEGIVFAEKRKLTLSKNGTSLNLMIQTGLDRINRKFKMTAAEKMRINKMIHFYYTQPFDPWMNTAIWMKYSHLLSVKNVTTTSYVNERLQNLKCRLKIAVINPNITSISLAQKRIFTEICNYGYDSAQYCLMQNTKVLRQISNEQRACLIVHEALRFLAQEKRPFDEFQLRRMTAAICTE